MELFRYTTSKKFMYFGKRKCMVESCVPSCKRQLFSFDGESVTDDVISQYQEPPTSNQNKDWVTCRKSNLEIDCTSSMNKFQLYLEVLNESIEASESDCESIEISESDCESIEASESDCESIEASESDCESIEAPESDCESNEALESDTVWIKDYELNHSNVNFSDSALCSELDVLEYSNFYPKHFENSGTALYDSGFCSDSSENFGSGLLSSNVCSDMYFQSNDNGDVIAEGQYHIDVIAEGQYHNDVIAEGQYHNDVMFCQDENVIMVSEMQSVTSPEAQTIGWNDCEAEKSEHVAICNDFMPMLDYYCPGSISNETLPVDFMEE